VKRSAHDAACYLPSGICRACAYASWVLENDEGHRESPSGPWSRTPRRRSHYTIWQIRHPTNLKATLGKTDTPHPLAFWRVQALADRLNVAFRGAATEVAVDQSTASIIVHPYMAVAGSGANANTLAKYWVGYESTWHSSVIQCCLALGWRLGVGSLFTFVTHSDGDGIA